MRLNPFRRKKKSRRRSSASYSDEGWLSPYAKKAIVGIILLVFSLIAILSFFDAAGPTGEAVFGILRKLFGWMAYLAPFALVALGGYLVWPQRLSMGRIRVIGLLLAGVGLIGILHILGASADDALQAAHEGKAGGYVGFLLTFPLSQALSRAASMLIFVASLLIGLILTFRVSPADIWEYLAGIFSKGKLEGEEGKVEAAEAEPLSRFRVRPVTRVPAAQEEAMEAPGLLAVRGRVSGRRYRPAVLKQLHISSASTTHNKEEEKGIKNSIQRALENFGIKVEMGGTNVGPTVTQYTLHPEGGTKLSRITALQNDLALALAAHPIRIEAPIPNTSLVGIEIPNKTASLVRLHELLVSKEFKEAESPLAFPLGRDVSGKVIVDSLERLPHLLIAGATGSGKSVNIHTLMISWLFHNSPDAVRFILVDPKRVELPPYNDLPHLLTPVIVDTEKTINALKWSLEEMDLRYRLLEEAGSRNLTSFNMNNPSEAKPFIVIVIDEMADLMVKHAREIEGPVVRLSQMARAVGIHLVLATQRPSVNVLTGLIKANIPARIAFTVASQVDSRTILDMAGAEKLLGNGDMLYLSGDKARPIRIQGGFVSEDEVRNVAKVVRQTGGSDYDETVISVSKSGSVIGRGSDDADDILFEDAKKVVIQADKASASLLQRRLRIGYARAARLLDVLEEKGIIGAAEGNKPRPVLAEVEGLDMERYEEQDAEGNRLTVVNEDQEDVRESEDANKRDQW